MARRCRPTRRTRCSAVRTGRCSTSCSAWTRRFCAPAGKLLSKARAGWDRFCSRRAAAWAGSASCWPGWSSGATSWAAPRPGTKAGRSGRRSATGSGPARNCAAPASAPRTGSGWTPRRRGRASGWTRCWTGRTRGAPSASGCWRRGRSGPGWASSYRPRRCCAKPVMRQSWTTVSSGAGGRCWRPPPRRAASYRLMTPPCI